MARGFNKVMLMGNLARDPDVRYTPNKQKVARFTIATGRQWKNRTTGELQEHTDFISCVAWGNTADIIERFLRKGRPVFVEGRITSRDFDDPKTGQHRWVTEVNVDNVILLGSPNRQDSAADTGYGQPQQYSAPVSDGFGSSDMGSLREETGFDDEFPLDFSEIKKDGGEDSGDVDIPF